MADKFKQGLEAIDLPVGIATMLGAATLAGGWRRVSAVCFAIAWLIFTIAIYRQNPGEFRAFQQVTIYGFLSLCLAAAFALVWYIFS